MYDRVSKDATSPTFKRNIGSAGHDGARHGSTDVGRDGLKDKQEMSFYMLSESEMVAPTTSKTERTDPKSSTKVNPPPLDGVVGVGKAMSHEMERVSKLFEILSSRSDIDHPICVECTELLIDGLQKRLEAATRERDAYIRFLKQVSAEIPTEEELQESQTRLEKAKGEESAAMDELLRLEKEKEEVDEEISQLEEKASALDLDEEEFWRSRNAFSAKLAEFQSERDSVNLKYDHDSQQKERLVRTNVYNDTFCISHDGSFGTINGLRLGRLSNVPVDWPEINAAWGHAILLLARVADMLGYKFEGYELQPMGSTSRIIKVDYPSPASSRSGPLRRNNTPKKTILELYSSGDMPLGLTFMHRKFDNAMVAFLECVRQLGAHVEQATRRTDRPLKLPYKIEGEKIDDVSIRLGIAQDDLWSKACKYTLTCCKFLLAHASNTNALNSKRPAS